MDFGVFARIFALKSLGFCFFSLSCRFQYNCFTTALQQIATSWYTLLQQRRRQQQFASNIDRNYRIFSHCAFTKYNYLHTMKINAFTFLQLILIASVDAIHRKFTVWQLGNNKKTPVHLAAFIAFAGLSGCIDNARAAIDCNSDCFSNCARVAPGSGGYCKELCTDYCDQPDRQDGLSGSIDSSKGETGIFGGSIDGTVTRSQDRPPKGIKIIPDGMLDIKSLMITGPKKQ